MALLEKNVVYMWLISIIEILLGYLIIKIGYRV